MKTGMELQQWAQTIKEQRENSEDYLADTANLAVDEDANLEIAGEGVFALTNHAHQQISTRLGIPRRYYRRLQQKHPNLFKTNINTLFKRENERRMVRTLNGTARAFLSDRFKRLDNFDVAEVVLPVIKEHDLVEVKSCAVTEKRMYLKAVFPKIQGEIRKGDIVHAGIAISNSEVGAGALSVEPLVYRLVCENGLISKEHGLRQIHVGSQIDKKLNGGAALLQQKTKQARDYATVLEVRDIVAACLQPDKFQKIVTTMREATDREIDGNPVHTVEAVGERFRLPENETSGIVNQLARSGDCTQYGLMNAVTRYAQDVDDYDRSTELETIGGDIVEMNDGEWNQTQQQARTLEHSA